VDRLLVVLPPRHGKSELVTIRYPVYRLALQPGLRVLVGAYNQDLAARFARRARRLARACPGLSLSAERAAAADWETAAGGGLRAVGVGAGVVGHGADLIVIDDPVKSREEAESPAYRDRVWDWFRDDLYTRQEPGCAVLLIQTRWHEDDLAGRLLRSPEAAAWRVLHLPALAEAPLHPSDPRAPGEALWPERFPVPALRRIEALLGPSFAALYQGRPNPATGGLFRREWFAVVPHLPPPVPFRPLRWVRFWDAAAKAGARNDFWAGALLGLAPDGFWYLASVVRGRWEYPEARRVVLATAAADGLEVPVVIEESASGIALLQDLRAAPEAQGHAFWPHRVTADKVLRAGPWAALAQGGRFRLLAGPWVEPFLAELLPFPLGPHDDQVDAVSGAHAFLAARARGPQRPAVLLGRPR